MPEPALPSTDTLTTAAAGTGEVMSVQGPGMQEPFKNPPQFLAIQPKLTVGTPDDPYEKEADAVADQVMRMPDRNFVQLKCETCEKESIQREENEEKEPADKSKLNLQLTEPDFLSLRTPFFERNAMHLWDPDSALGVWKYNFGFFRRFGLDDNWSGKAANLTAPFFINSQLKAGNPTWWEITDQQLNTTSIVGSLPIFSFDSDFINWKPLPFLQKKTIDPASTAQKPDSPLESFIQRKCNHCEEEKTINRKSLSTAITPFIQTKGDNNIPSVSSSLSQSIQSSRGSGSSLDYPTQTFMGSRFGVDFGDVKVHTDVEAIQMNRELNAKAFTVGNDVYFNEGKYQPNSTEGKQLLAHELTHVVQQKEPSMQLQGDAGSDQDQSPVQNGQFIIEDSLSPVSGQMSKTVFLNRLNEAVCLEVNRELEGTPYSSDNCPYISSIFARQAGSSPFKIEQLAQRYEPQTSQAQSAEELIQLILIRVRDAVTRWKINGSLSDVPEDLSPILGTTDINSSPEEELNSDDLSLQFKSNDNISPGPTSPLKVMKSLGNGHSLEAGTQNKMQNAFGTDFSNVEIHTGSHAEQLSKDLNARAFAVGKHIAFNSGEYQPGTILGDALIAHELAHVRQQDFGNRKNPIQNEDNAEKDANKSTLGAMGKMLHLKSIKEGLLSENYKSGLSLSRCTTEVRTEFGHSQNEPDTYGKNVGVWQRNTPHGQVRHDLLIEDLLIRPGGEEGTFEFSYNNLEEASAFAHVMISSRMEDGGVIIQDNNRFKVYAIDVDPSRLLFTRQTIEEDYMTESFIDTSAAELSGVIAFISSDGYRVPINRDIRLHPNRLVPNAVPVEDIEMSGYERVAQDLTEGRDLNLSTDGYIALFKGILKANSERQLDQNRIKLNEEQRKYSEDTSDTNTTWRRLRVLIDKDKALANHQSNFQNLARDLRNQASFQRTRAGFGEATYAQAAESQRQSQHFQDQVEQVKQYRTRLRAEYPPLSVLNTDEITAETTNATILARIQTGFDEVRAIIEDVKERIHTEDIPVNKLGTMVTQTKEQLNISEERRRAGDALSEAVLGWLNSEDTTEQIITWSGTILSLVLGVAAIIASGGWAIFLGLAGSAVGLGTAVYEFERAEDLYDASRAGGSGGGHLIDDPDAARFNYIMGWVNLLLSGLDLGIAARATSTLVRGGRIAEELAGSLGGDVLRRLRPEQISRFDDAMRLRRAGDVEGAQQILDRLRSQLGDEVFEQANSLFGRASKSRQLFDSMAGLSTEAKRALLNLDEAIMERLPALGEAAIENVGQFISRNGTDAAVLINRGGDQVLDLSARLGSTVGGELENLFRVFIRTRGNLREQFLRLMRMADLPMDIKGQIISELGIALRHGRIPIDDLTGVIAVVTRAGGNAEQIALNARQAFSELQNAQRIVREGLSGSVRINAVKDVLYELGEGITTRINPMEEIDALFVRGGTVFAHEVKDTMIALINKLRSSPNQLQRMIDWLAETTAGHPRAVQVIVQNEARWTDLFSTIAGGNNGAQTLSRAGVPLRIGNFEFTPAKLLELNDAMHRYWVSQGRPLPPTFFSRPELQNIAEVLRNFGITL